MYVKVATEKHEKGFKYVDTEDKSNYWKILAEFILNLNDFCGFTKLVFRV